MPYQRKAGTALHTFDEFYIIEHLSSWCVFGCCGVRDADPRIGCNKACVTTEAAGSGVLLIL